MSVSAQLHQIEIPFRFRFDHASAKRAASDSLILRIEDDDGRCGWGEALLRSYVGGLPEGSDVLRSAARIVPDLITRLGGAQWPLAVESLATVPVQAFERPLLCAIESALLGLECQRQGGDIYDVLGIQPAREEVTYGVILPILPSAMAEDLLLKMKAAAMPALRIKLSRDTDYNESILSLSRQVMGNGFDIRVDVNSSWVRAEIAEQLALCRRYGVRIIEDPGKPGILEEICDELKEGFLFASDESFVSESDLERIIDHGEFGMLNIRLAKNGGILRCLQMAKRAATAGLAYSLGCHPGETGILSALGRVTASILPAPTYVDGSYDSILLSGNLTTENFDFGANGRAPIMKDRGIGFAVDPARIRQYSRDSVELSL